MKLNSNFHQLDKLEIVEAYKNLERRLLFLDYEGTLQYLTKKTINL